MYTFIPQRQTSVVLTGPNQYGLDPMLGPKTVRHDKKQAPSYSLVGRRTIGGFHEDLTKVNNGVNKVC